MRVPQLLLLRCIPERGGRPSIWNHGTATLEPHDLLAENIWLSDRQRTRAEI